LAAGLAPARIDILRLREIRLDGFTQNIVKFRG
jgi:hypothetical protein